MEPMFITWILCWIFNFLILGASIQRNMEIKDGHVAYAILGLLLAPFITLVTLGFYIAKMYDKN